MKILQLVIIIVNYYGNFFLHKIRFPFNIKEKNSLCYFIRGNAMILQHKLSFLFAFTIFPFSFSSVYNICLKDFQVDIMYADVILSNILKFG